MRSRAHIQIESFDYINTRPSLRARRVKDLGSLSIFKSLVNPTFIQRNKRGSDDRVGRIMTV